MIQNTKLLADKTEILSGTEIYTDKADDSVVHVEVDGKSYQHAGSGKNLLKNPNSRDWIESSFGSTESVTVREINGEFIIKAIAGDADTFGATQRDQSLSLEKDKDYTLSFELRGDVTRMSYIYMLNTEGLNTQLPAITIVPSSQEFTRVSIPFIYTSDSPNAYLMISTHNRGGTWFEFKNVMLEEGSAATAYEPPAPIPDYPIKIHSLNDFDVVSQKSEGGTIDGIEVGGRNLIIRNTETPNTWINVSGDITRAVDHDTSDYIKVEPNTDYMLTKSDSGLAIDEGFFRWAWYGLDKTYIGRVANSNNEILWKTPNNVHYVRVSYPTDSSPKLEKGTTATDWTPAPEDITESDNHPLIDKINLSLGEPLRSVGDVKDRLFRDSDGLWKIERNIGVIVFDGSESWTMQSNSDYGDGQRFMVDVSDSESRTTRNPVKSSHFTSFTGGGHKLNVAFQWGSAIFIYLPSSIATTISQLKSWLATNNVEFSYFLDSFKIETLDQELQDKLNNLRSFQDSNYVYTIINDKTDILSERLKPTLHATFKSNAFTNENRDMAAKINVNGAEIYSEDKLADLQVSLLAEVEGIWIGQAIPKELKIKLINKDLGIALPEKGTKIEAYVGVKTDETTRLLEGKTITGPFYTGDIWQKPEFIVDDLQDYTINTDLATVTIDDFLGARRLVYKGSDGKDTFSWADWKPANLYQTLGTYYVHSIEKKEDTNIVEIIAYDRLKSLQEIEINPITYPISIGRILDIIQAQTGLRIDRAQLLFETYEILEPVFFGRDNTIVDVIKAIAGANLTFAYISYQGDLVFRRPTKTSFDINLKNTFNLKVKGRQDPINSLVLSRMPQEDNVALQMAGTTEENKVELKIANNPILDTNREYFLQTLLTEANKITYDGVEQLRIQSNPLLELGDIVTVAGYNIPILNHAISMTRSEIKAKIPAKTETDYTKAKGIEERLVTAELSVDKVEGEILGVVSSIEGEGGIKERLNEAELKITDEGIMGTVTESTQWEALNGEVQTIETNASTALQTANKASLEFNNFKNNAYYEFTDTAVNFKYNGQNMLSFNGLTGDLKITGKITATSGTIGGFEILDNKLRIGSTTGPRYIKISGDPAGHTIQVMKDGSTTFYLKDDGTLVANNAFLTGKITATSGTIAGFTIDGSTLQGGNGMRLAGGSGWNGLQTDYTKVYSSGKFNGTSGSYSGSSYGYGSFSSGSYTGSGYLSSGRIGGSTYSNPGSGSVRFQDIYASSLQLSNGLNSLRIVSNGVTYQLANLSNFSRMSDITLKENIKTVKEEFLEDIYNIPIISYNYKKGVNPEEGKFLGINANYVKEHASEKFSDHVVRQDEVTKKYSADYQNMVSMNTLAIQDLNERLSKLEGIKDE